MQEYNFFTPLGKVESTFTVNYKDKVVALGSCFTTEMGKRLKAHNWDIWNNETGILFNPVSIFSFLYRTLENIPEEETLFVQKNGLWYHLHWHSQVYAETKEELIDSMEKYKTTLKESLKESTLMLFTLGTSIVRKKGDFVCGNCHKQPKEDFSTVFLSEIEIVSSFNKFYGSLQKLNPTLKMLFTVSPIRHTKEGLVNNSRSKAVLLSAVHQIVEKNESFNYFPSYEIMLDMLRDYRFYKQDMIHPTEQAVEIIWAIFKDSFFNDKTNEIVKKQTKLLKMSKHKIQNTSATEEIEKLVNKMKNLKLEIEKLREV